VSSRALRALVFDVDGVLAEIERDGHLPAFNEAFRTAGFEWDWEPELYRRLLKIRDRGDRLRHFFKYWRPCGIPRTGSEPLVEALCRRERRSFLRRLASGAVPLRTGVARLVREAAAAGLVLGVAPAGSREAAELLLRANLGSEDVGLIDQIGAGLPAGKAPSADLYGPLLRELRCRPENAVLIASSPERCAVAEAAGLSVVVTPSEYTPRRRFPGARIVVTTLGDAEHPFRVVTGDGLGHRTVTVRALRAWHADWAGQL
jgi:beta-phosphoglucomutase-like phosphatase (HAD superfamily)